MKKSLFSVLGLFLLIMPMELQAQEAVPAAANAAPAEVAAPSGDTNAAPTEAAAPAAESNDPGDIIAAYFDKMSDIIATNMDTPEALLEKFSAYIKENEKSMKAASKAFDSKLNSMKSNEAEVYRETVQRKITPSLNKLISLLIDFSSRHPVEAQKLDSLLKVDAKYTYQQ